jgi:mannose-1-phosphate guanylyltransferase
MTAAVVLAAGPGTRLGDIGARMPKTMIPVAGRPYLEHLAGRLLRAGLRPVVVAVHHHADTILDHFAGHASAAALRFVHTDQRGTGADLMQCLDAIPDAAFIVWNGDTIVDLDLPHLLVYGERHPGSGIIVLSQRPDAPNRNAWYVDTDGTVLATLEAAPAPPPPAGYAWRGSSAGVLLLTKSLLDSYRSREAPDLYATILPSLIGRRQLSAYDNGDRYFLDFGTPQALARLDHDQVAGWTRSRSTGQPAPPHPGRLPIRVHHGHACSSPAHDPKPSRSRRTTPTKFLRLVTAGR